MLTIAHRGDPLRGLISCRLLGIGGLGWSWPGADFGKTRLGAESVIEYAQEHPRSIIHLVGRSAADVRDVMITGDSGILKCSRQGFYPVYEPSKRLLTWPNGAYALCFSAEKPDQLRGPQCHFAWADELAAWKVNKSSRPVPDAWDQLLFGLRLGKDPRVIVTTTPRPTKVIRDLTGDAGTHVTRGSTFENSANLASSYLEKIVTRYQGTRLGQQELYGAVLDDNPGALWQRGMVDAARVLRAPELVRIVVAIDPSSTASEDSDECGIVVAGLGSNGHGYVLEDLSCRVSVEEWANKAIKAFDRYQADKIIIETNHGGDMAPLVLRNAAKAMHEREERDSPSVPIQQVKASRGKQTRAEPVAALAEQGKIHHVTYCPERGEEPASFLELEDQLCTWDPVTSSKSPDRLDALVWAMTALRPGVRLEKKSQTEQRKNSFWDY